MMKTFLWLWTFLLFCHSIRGQCQCLDTGRCGAAGPGCHFKCQPGFTGDNCQYINVAYGASAVEEIQRLLDGDYDTCLRYSPGGNQKITFSAPASVDAIRLHLTKEKNVAVYAYLLSGTNRVESWNIPGFAKRLNGTVKTVTFPVQRNIQYIELPLKRVVCELEVSSSDLLATTSQMPQSTASLSPIPNTDKPTHLPDTTQPPPPTPAQKCTSGTYAGGRIGSGCKDCSEGCEDTCNHVDGSCQCRPGYRGQGCDKACQRGKYGSGCDSSCSVGCKDTCDPVYGSCQCQPGWRGQKCDSECPSGEYGAGCSESCSVGCKNQQCDHVTGECTDGRCKIGWVNSRKCDEECPSGKYGAGCLQSCSAGCRYQQCDHETGVCTYSRCNKGWTNSVSGEEKCDTCQPGRYGSGCSRSCSVACEDTCDHVDGSCQCKPGWTGQRCAKECSRGKYGVRCSQSCSPGCLSKREQRRCDHETGACTNGCNTGWIDSVSAAGSGKCDKKCSSGKYGAGCSQSCSPGCPYRPHFRLCDHETGVCTYSCNRGWTNTVSGSRKCDTKCESGSYGDRCRYRCAEGCTSGHCNHVNGHCTCKPGWRKERCNSKCGRGYYGDGCQTQCGEGCSGGRCYHVTGNCSCVAGWVGDTCSTQCARGMYGSGCGSECAEGCVGGECSHTDGRCGCKPGWTGNKCTYKCRSKTYGQGCTGVCGQNCRTCHHVTGSCQADCNSGKFGENCTMDCEPGTYGDGCESSCHVGCQAEKCDSVTGDCGTNCVAGWTGYNCVDECAAGLYGENCVYNCSEGCRNSTCDRVSGQCDQCLQGWQHDPHSNTTRCDRNCDMGLYGDGCSMECSSHCVNQSCHHVLGECLAGCLTGRSGTHCHIAASGMSIGLVVSILVLLVLLVLGIIVLFMFRSRIRQKLRPSNEPSPEIADVFPMVGTPNAEARNGIELNGGDMVNDGDLYANTSAIARATCVPVSGLKDYVEQKKSKKNILPDEYAKIPKALTAAHDIALTPENTPKNRFRGVYPYNHSLVVLKGEKGKPRYINANYIDGPTRMKQYIATQGPLPHTVGDFWEMVLQNNVPVIVMLANVMEDGKRRCEPYWTNEAGNKQVTFGPITISQVDETCLADYTIRTLTIKKGDITAIVKHVHYTVWPDKGVPGNTMSLVSLRQRARSLSDFSLGPMLVHCSAGVGRTGTLIALDYLMEQADTHNTVDIYGCVWALRGCRVLMVQTEIQYLFLHDCVLDALWYTSYPVPASLFSNDHRQLKRQSGNNLSPNLEVRFQNLQDCPRNPNVCKSAKLQKNIYKNRSMDILAGDSHRPFLTCQVDGTTDYINAVFVPSYEKNYAFILTQTPLNSTVVDIWRLVVDRNIRGVVLLDDFTGSTTSDDCGVFLPKKNEEKKFGPFTVSMMKSEDQQGFNIENYKYQYQTQEGYLTVFRCTFWSQWDSLPETATPILCFLDFVRQWNTSVAPLVVMCRDGSTRSGLFCVLSVVIDRLRLENEVAIQQTIRRMRVVREQIISSKEQFEFCYDAVKMYMDTFNEYSNFT